MNLEELEERCRQVVECQRAWEMLQRDIEAELDGERWDGME